VWEDLPNDLVLALEALRPYVLCSSFPLPVFPLAVLCGHVGAASALALRRELAELCAAGTARELRLLGGEEAVVVLSSDLEAHLRRAQAGDDAHAARARAFLAFLARSHATPHVSHADLAVAYRAWLKAGASVGATGSSGGGGSGSGGGGGGGFGLEQAVKALLGSGLLLRKASPGALSQDYYLGVPEGRLLAQCLSAGREELLSRVRRAPGRQLPREHVLRRALKSSPFPTIVHLREALGRGLVTVQHLSDGPYVRWGAV